ncbi:MAG TPA: orotate phosphoribosyltransferase [Candidatus Saccharicenans sp.]|nr:orotate phosphoribosyltransferase [Candidatus Saccharicenans sp.]
MPEKPSAQVLKLFEDSQALLRGHFKLTSGKHSEWYFEKIKLIERPLILEKIIDLLVEKIRQDSPAFDYVVSPAYGGIAIGFLTALKLNKFFAFSQRVEEKMTIRSGFSGLDKSKAIIVEDIVTTGGSVREVVECLRQKEVQVAGIYCLVDRSGGEVLFAGQPASSLLSLKVEAFEPENCPLCRQNLPLIKPGASDKK